MCVWLRSWPQIFFLWENWNKNMSRSIFWVIHKGEAGSRILDVLVSFVFLMSFKPTWSRTSPGHLIDNVPLLSVSLLLMSTTFSRKWLAFLSSKLLALSSAFQCYGMHKAVEIRHSSQNKALFYKEQTWADFQLSRLHLFGRLIIT